MLDLEVWPTFLIDFFCKKMSEVHLNILDETNVVAINHIPILW